MVKMILRGVISGVWILKKTSENEGKSVIQKRDKNFVLILYFILFSGIYITSMELLTLTIFHTSFFATKVKNI